MSKLAKAIDYEVSSHQYYKQLPFKFKYTDVNFSVSDDMSTIGSRIREYKIGVTLETKAFCSDYDPNRDVIIKAVKRAMIEEVFGEFRPMIYNLQAALYDRDTNEAEKIVQELDRVMFHEGLE